MAENVRHQMKRDLHSCACLSLQMCESVFEIDLLLLVVLDWYMQTVV
jgi:hypothetical protein